MNRHGSPPRKPHQRRCASPAMIFLVVTLAATVFQYLATRQPENTSPLFLALPPLSGGIFALLFALVSRRQCSQCDTQAELDRLRDIHDRLLAENTTLRRRNAEAERQFTRLQRRSDQEGIATKRLDARFQVAFHATPDPILFSNAETGLIMDVNESFLRLLGIRWNDVMGASVDSLITWSSPSDAERFRTLRTSESVSNLTVSIRTSAGRQRRFLISARAVELEGVRSNILIARDVTDMEQLRQELANKTELLESILRHIPYYIFWKDTKHRYAGANEQFRKAVLGSADLPMEGLTSEDMGGLFPHTCRDEDSNILAGAPPIINDERTLLTADGERADVLVSKVPLRDKRGTITGLLGIIADISDLRKQERLFLMLLNGIDDPAWLKDAQGRYCVVNRAFADITGHPASALAGRTDADVLPGTMAAHCEANDMAVLKTGMPLRNDEQWEISGSHVWYEVIRRPLSEAAPDGESAETVIGTMGIARDISARRRVEDENRKLSRAMDQSTAAVAITTSEGIVEYSNPRFTEVTGYLPAELYGRMPHILATVPHTTPEDIWRGIQCGESWQSEFRARRKGGAECWLAVSISPIMDDAGNIQHALIVLDDITRRREQEEYIRYMAMHDGLTTLPNRRLFMSQLRHAVAVHNRQGTPFALLFLDLNNFKAVNDTLGHDAGDIVLKTVAERIHSCLREVDTAARLGGDEFVVLLHDIGGIHEVHSAGTRITQAIHMPIILGEETRVVGAAIGVALCPQHGTDPDELLSHADKAMYRCKQEGHCPYAAVEDSLS